MASKRQVAVDGPVVLVWKALVWSRGRSSGGLDVNHDLLVESDLHNSNTNKISTAKNEIAASTNTNK